MKLLDKLFELFVPKKKDEVEPEVVSVPKPDPVLPITKGRGNYSK